MQLRELIFGMDVLDIDGPVNREVSGLYYDARRVMPGGVYFALERGGEDGHRQIELAIGRGAVAVVCRRRGSMRQGATKIEVSEPRQALAQAAAVMHGHIANRLKIIGITGEKRPWNIAFLLKQILEAAGIKTGLISSVRHEIGERRLPVGAFFPEPSDVHEMLAEMAADHCAACVIEYPSTAFSRESIDGLGFDVFVFADGRNETAARWVQNANSEKAVCSVVNVDEGAGGPPASRGVIEVELRYGLGEQADVRAREVTCGLDQTRLQVEIAGRCFDCNVPLIGRQNIHHLLGAISAAASLDLGERLIMSTLWKVSSPPGNMERVAAGQDVFVDEARTPGSVREVLQAARELAAGRVLAVVGCSEKTTGRDRFELGRVAGELCDHVVLTSDNPGREAVEQICSAIAQGIDAAGGQRYHFQPDRARAIRELIYMRRPGDVLIIFGKGGRTYQEIASTIVPFDDRVHAAEALEGFIEVQVQTETVTGAIERPVEKVVERMSTEKPAAATRSNALQMTNA